MSQNYLSAEKLPIRSVITTVTFISELNKMSELKKLKTTGIFCFYFKCLQSELFFADLGCTVIFSEELVSLQYCFILITVVLVHVTCKGKQKILTVSHLFLYSYAIIMV